jgi:hypothetical protein
MKDVRSRFFPFAALSFVLSFFGCATAPFVPSADSSHSEVYLCETFDHDLVNIFVNQTQVYSAQITTKADLAGVAAIPAKEAPIHLRIEVPGRHAKLVQTIDPKQGRYLMVSMDRNYQLSLTQRVDQPALD